VLLRDEIIISNINQDLTVFTINETWFCPIKCKYCHIRNKASLLDKTVLSTENLIEGCNQAKKLQFKEYRISGGEPTIIGEKLFYDAKIIKKIVNKKPSLLTSGFFLSDIWCENASNLFSNIFISAESPINPYHSHTNPNQITNLIKERSSKKLPLKFGVILIPPTSYKHLYEIFSFFYNGVDGLSYPQISSPSIRSYIQPNHYQLSHLKDQTSRIFRDFGPIPFYFTEFIGPIQTFSNKIKRYVININPDGGFTPYSSAQDALYNKISDLNSINRHNSECKKCNWADCCNPWENRINIPTRQLCKVRISLFEGIFEGLKKFGN